MDSEKFDISKLYGVIAPHAGYPYSGEIAAYSYDLLSREQPGKIIIIAPSHREFLDGFSIYPGKFYSTPLGKVAIEQNFVEKIVAECSAVEKNIAGHKEEHSLEVQLPFLQYLLDEFKIVPIIAGNASIKQVEELAKCLAELGQEAEFCVVASSDLSHFHSYDRACNKDLKLIEELKKFDIAKLIQGHKDRSLEACGMIPISVLLEYGRVAGDPKFKALDYRNSGDTAGGKNRVVGYLSAAIYE